jgi:hypothetical protein
MKKSDFLSFSKQKPKNWAKLWIFSDFLEFLTISQDFICKTGEKEKQKTQENKK